MLDNPYNTLKPVIEANARDNHVETGDYIDENGYVCCHICGSRRQTDITLPNSATGETKTIRVWSNCKCRQEKMERELEEKKKAEEMEVISALQSKSLMNEKLYSAVFENFKQTESNSRNLKLCKRYAERFDEMVEKNQGLLFTGDTGTGKTYAAACIANYLLKKRVPVLMTSFVKLLEEGNRDNEDETLARISRVKLLIIDDLGAERSTDYALEKVYNVVDSRYRSKKPVIMTTNLSLEEMKEATDLRYKRIYDRIFEMCYPMNFTGASWRKREAARRADEMKELLEDDQ